MRAKIKDVLRSDLHFILEDCSVPLRAQLSLAEAGFSTLRLFANIADSKKELRELIKTDLGVEPIGAENKRIHAAVLSAWDGAKELAQKESELRAEARVLGERRPPTIQERASMRRLVETSYGPISSIAHRSTQAQETQSPRAYAGKFAPSNRRH